MSEQNEVFCRLEAPLGRLTLNRPSALHALNFNMCKLMIDALLAWRSDDSVKAIWIDHRPETRGFCAVAGEGTTDAPVRLLAGIFVNL